MTFILGIESSCDETAMSLVDANGRVLAHELESQILLHRKFGGVVPEVASRTHFEIMDFLWERVREKNPHCVPQIKAVAASMTPGLIGPLLVGASYAQGLATGLGVPFYGVHHLRAHIASVLLGDHGKTMRDRARDLFPATVLLVSGGHTQVLLVHSNLRAETLLGTVDDAAGECFDKSAKLMGLPYPGGPEIERLAARVSEAELATAKALSAKLPRPKTQDANFSFSGLKTAIRNCLEKSPDLNKSPVFAWAVQDAIADCLVLGLNRSMQRLDTHPRTLIVCGGVAANVEIRTRLASWATSRGMHLELSPLPYCTDNAAMVAACAWVQDPNLAPTQVTARTPL